MNIKHNTHHLHVVFQFLSYIEGKKDGEKQLVYNTSVSLPALRPGTLVSARQALHAYHAVDNEGIAIRSRDIPDDTNRLIQPGHQETSLYFCP